MAIAKSFIWPVFLFVLLSGCSSNALMPISHLYTVGDKPLFEELAPELKTTQVDLMYVTDRLVEEAMTSGYCHTIQGTLMRILL